MIIKYFNCFFLAAICLLFASKNLQAQADTTAKAEITQAQQEEVLQYLSELQRYQQLVQSEAIAFNELQFQSQLSKEERQKQQEARAKNVEKHLNGAKMLKVPEDCKKIHEAILVYWQQKALVFGKLARREYQKAAEAELNCSRCMKAAIRAHELHKAESPKDKEMTELTDREMERLGEKYSFSALTPEAQRKAAYDLQDIQEYVLSLSIIAGYLGESFAQVGKTIEKVQKKQTPLTELSAAIVALKQDCEQAEQALQKIEKSELSCWNATKAIIDEALKIVKERLPKIEKLLSKSTLTEADKQQIHSEWQACSSITKPTQAFKNAMNAALQKRIKAVKDSQKK